MARVLGFTGIFGAGALLFVATAHCGELEQPATDAGADGASSSSSSSSSGAVVDGATDGAGSSSSTSSSSSGATTMPPGCTDGGPSWRFVLVDATTIRISSLQGSDADLCAGSLGVVPNESCPFPYYAFDLSIPDTSSAHTWTLPAAGVALTQREAHPRIFDEEKGCSCGPTSTAPELITSGIIEIEPQAPGTPSFPLKIELTNVDVISPMGTTSALVKGCN